MPRPAARLAELADGDGRYLLNMVENLADLPAAAACSIRRASRQVLQRRMPLYDRQQEAHYNLISALHKSVRGSDPDAALYWLARMLAGRRGPALRRPPAGAHGVRGHRPRRSRRRCRSRSPRARPTSSSAAPRASWRWPQCAVHLACAPKSNAVYRAFGAACARRAGERLADAAGAHPERADPADEASSATAAATPTTTTRPSASRARTTSRTAWSAQTFYQPDRRGRGGRDQATARGAGRSCARARGAEP